ncbi:MAG: hypothetical protein QG582_173 [Candidatus Thermoplasmatota archaeon]|nr:hypothetical protein [Candidatus Thermoplasmatota archaeon]
MDLSHLRLCYCRNSAIECTKKSPRWDDEGVSATIGTIMSLLVFLTMMGMFTNQFVPVWMSDNESTHMADAMTQIIGLKADIDGMVVDYSDSQLAPAPIVAPITLHAPGIPIFAEATSGILQFNHETMYAKPCLNVSYDEGGTDGYVLGPTTGGHSGGYLSLYSPNRYYVEQRLIYENGAVILNQTDGEFVVTGPQFAVSDVSGSRVVKITQVSMLGMNKTIGGTGTKLVNAEMLYAGTTELRNDGGNDVTISIVSIYGSAWENYFKNALNGSLADLDYTSDYSVSKEAYPFVYLGRSIHYYVVTVVIHDVNILEHSRATLQVSLGDVAA